MENGYIAFRVISKAFSQTNEEKEMLKCQSKPRKTFIFVYFTVMLCIEPFIIVAIFISIEFAWLCRYCCNFWHCMNGFNFSNMQY